MLPESSSVCDSRVSRALASCGAALCPCLAHGKHTRPRASSAAAHARVAQMYVFLSHTQHTRSRASSQHCTHAWHMVCTSLKCSYVWHMVSTPAHGKHTRLREPSTVWLRFVFQCFNPCSTPQPQKVPRFNAMLQPRRTICKKMVPQNRTSLGTERWKTMTVLRFEKTALHNRSAFHGGETN